ncbi:hypothetical protein BST81_10615 [Leptolyngbya sp. 'hensonii']|uniref:hypothetical protein n=1 Tax=Leptolyngbya sp. 'hensonii' TaxID=1922337 RepID=UPI000950296B|nr:hypothetical protein [Leptolyngbya sp. 'hensonii']OLP18412.1 hypothetical protein BST81_10615 [Leptolyngbya sp. 'hensonii']
MQTHKAQKIDLNTDYPCPCRRRGRLVPISLTEAFGCNRCQQIFVVQDSGYVIEQLSTTYPYKRSWRWSGHQWNFAHSGFRENYLPLALGMIGVLLVICLPLALRAPNHPSSTIPWLVLFILLAMLPALMLWLAYRR